MTLASDLAALDALGLTETEQTAQSRQIVGAAYVAALTPGSTWNSGGKSYRLLKATTVDPITKAADVLTLRFVVDGEEHYHIFPQPDRLPTDDLVTAARGFMAR